MYIYTHNLTHTLCYSSHIHALTPAHGTVPGPGRDSSGHAPDVLYVEHLGGAHVLYTCIHMI